MRSSAISAHLISRLANKWRLDVPACVLYLPSRTVECIFSFSFCREVGIEPLPHLADASELQDYSHAYLVNLPFGLGRSHVSRYLFPLMQCFQDYLPSCC